MAIGAALLFNIKLPINFNSPFKATGIIDFWQRWHITLTKFITTYIYTPLVRSFNNLTFHKAMIATVITFLIAGLWHGASWMFVIFGGLHGIGLVINNYWKKRKIKMNKVLAWFITFNFVNIAFVFFRAKDWNSAIKVLGSMFNLDNMIFNLNYLQVVILFFGFIIVLFFKNSASYLNTKFNFSFKKIIAFVVLMTISILAIRLGNSNEFLYFNF
jgi:D-alanyl-lipoteichoic acid acyltransferase DltB (MBOAT superfamily)